jgi:acetyl-CoA C-acetyltransferase
VVTSAPLAEGVAQAGITAARRGAVLEIVIDREHAGNSLDPAAHAALDQVLDGFEGDPTLRVAILTGSGERFFCAGHDLKSLGSDRTVGLPAHGFGGLTSRVGLEKPVIAAVNGLALGGGLELVLASHLCVATEDAELALTEVRVGMIAAAGGIAALPHRIPAATANEMILTGRRMTAAEAFRLGLVNRVTAVGSAMAGARDLADEILECSPTSVRLSLRLLNAARRAQEALDPVTVEDAMRELLSGQDWIEGMTAFREGRRAVWPDAP